MTKRRFSDSDIKQNSHRENGSIKKVSFLSLINPRNLDLELKRCGYEFTVDKYVKFMLTCFLGLMAAAFVFKLQITYIIPILILSLILMPSVFLLQYRNLYEQSKFEDITGYMEQLLYSFKRQPKILTALEDTLMLFQGDADSRLGQAIRLAIEHIRNGYAEGNIYREAFAYIEDEYGCKRLYKIHDFLIHAEETGGNCDDSVDVLLLDRNLWMDRIYDLIRDKQKMRTDISIAIGLSLVMVGLSIYMVPSDFGIAVHPASQIVTCICLCIDLLLWFGVQKSLSGSLLDADSDRPFREIEKAYRLVMNENLAHKKKKDFMMVGTMLAAAAVVSYFSMGIKVAILIGVFAMIVMTQPGRTLKNCRKRVTKEVEKAFPEWLMSLALQMQTDNVHVSIVKTIPEAPEVLREELYKFQDGIEKYPSEVEPYLNFMKQFNIMNITSAMKQLYANAEFGSEHAQDQIRALVERNTKLMDRAEKLRMEDQLAGISFSALLPMITGAVKLVVDLALVMFYILSTVQGL